MLGPRTRGANQQMGQGGQLTISFNLTEEAWIPCLSVSGQYRALSLRHFFERASEIREISHPSPLVKVGLHRLLLAIIHRNFGPASLDEWRKVWSARCWEVATLNAYFDRWRHRFDLFDPNRPFYQKTYMPDAKVHPIQKLLEEKASGNNPTLFDHSTDDSPTPLLPSEAACYLIATQSYSIGFGRSNPFYLQDSTLVRGLTVRMIGDNEFETLMLNLIRYHGDYPIPRSGCDVPAWEQEEPPDPDRNGTTPAGYLDYLTWQSRRIHLIPKGNPLTVAECQIQQNLKLPENYDYDPFKAYRKDKERGMIPLGLSEGKALWRDSHALFQDAAESSPPKVMQWAAQINRLDDESIRPKYAFEAIGVATTPRKAASILFWRNERLPLPLKYLDDDNLIRCLRDALDWAELMARTLDQVIKEMAKRILATHEKPPVQGFVEHLGADRAYWSRLEGPFKRFMEHLPYDQDEYGIYGNTELQEWKKTLLHTVRDAFEEATRSMERSTRTLKELVVAEKELASRTHWHLVAQEEGNNNGQGKS